MAPSKTSMGGLLGVIRISAEFFRQPTSHSHGDAAMAARARAGSRARLKKRPAPRAAAKRGRSALSRAGAPKRVSTRRSPAKAAGNGHARDLLARLKDGPVICAEGYLFELERRGYLQAGAFVPE